MPATVVINRLTGAGPTKTAITDGNTRMSTSDAPTPGTGNPIPVPDAGTNRSFWVTTRLEATVAPDNLIDNIRWFSDGTNSFGTGVTCVGQTADSYVQATGTEGETGTELTQANHAGLTAAPVDVFSLTSASPKAVTGSTSTAIEFGQRFCYQLAVGTTAGAGTTGTEVWSWRFDES